MPVVLPVAPLMMVNGNGMKKMMGNVCQQVDQVLDLAQALGGVLVLDQVVVLLLVLVLDQVQILVLVLVSSSGSSSGGTWGGSGNDYVCPGEDGYDDE